MRKCLLIILCYTVSILVSAQTKSFQVWTGIGTSYDVSKRLSIEFEAESRFQQTGATLKQASACIGGRYNLTKKFYAGASYEFSDKYKKNGYFPVHTFAASVGYKKKFGDFRLSLQSKLNLAKNSYTKKQEDIYPEIVNKNKIKFSYAGFNRIKPGAFIETYHPLESGSNYHISTVKYDVNCSFDYRWNTTFNVGYMFRHEIDENEIISILTFAVSKSF